MDGDMKIVDFQEYCETCQYQSKKEYEEPCDECLSIPARPNSHKPEKYKEKKK